MKLRNKLSSIFSVTSEDISLTHMHTPIVPTYLAKKIQFFCPIIILKRWNHSLFKYENSSCSYRYSLQIITAFCTVIKSKVDLVQAINLWSDLQVIVTQAFLIGVSHIKII